MPLADYLPQSDDLPDQFEPMKDGHPFTFPCNVCKHQDRLCDDPDCNSGKFLQMLP